MPILLITRPAPAGERFAEAVRAGPEVTVILAPLQKIAPVAADPLPEEVTGVVFTSANGVAQAGRFDLPPGLTAWCVGDRTAQAASEAGFDAVSASGDADDLVALILDRAPLGPLIHLRGEHGVGDVCGRLVAGGTACAERVVYRQVAVPLSPRAAQVLDASDPVVLPLFSPRSARILAESGPFRAPLHVVAISEAVARATADLAPATLRPAPRPDGAAMVAETRTALATLAASGSLEAPPEAG